MTAPARTPNRWTRRITWALISTAAAATWFGFIALEVSSRAGA